MRGERTDVGFAFIDLYIDVTLHNGRVTVKDKELLERLDEREAATARDLAYRLVARADAQKSFFDPTSPLWNVPSDARILPPGSSITLSPGA